MNNLTIETKRVVTANFSAAEWGLLTVCFPRDEIEEVANKLNQRLNDYANNGYTMKQTRDGMFEFLSKWSKYGAFDTEPRMFLEHVLGEIYHV